MTDKKKPDSARDEGADDSQVHTAPPTAPVSRHERSEDGLTATTTEHVPGQPNPHEEDDRTSRELVEEREQLDAKAREEASDRHRPALVDVRSPETAYATKDNIVYPGRIHEAVYVEAVARALVNADNVEVAVDPTQVDNDDDQTVAERVDELRDEVELPDEPRPVSGPV